VKYLLFLLILLATSGCGLVTADNTMEAHDRLDYYSNSHIHWSEL
jgi:uncharacterized protein YceK